MTDISRMQQYQLDGLLNSSGSTNYGSLIPSTKPEVQDIWTQASQLENKYVARLKNTPSLEPAETSKIMNDFMIEAMDMLYSSLNKGSSVASTNGTTSNSTASSSTTTITDTNPTTPSTTVDTTSEVTEETTNSTNTQTDSTASAKVKKYQKAILDDIQKGGYAVYNGAINDAISDAILSTDEKISVLKFYREALKNAGITDATTYREGLLTDELYKSLSEGKSSAANIIKSLNTLNELLGTDKKGNQILAVTNGSKGSTFAVELYLKAQQEGVLADALKAAPPVESVQKQLSLGTETKAITGLFEKLDENVNKNAKTKAEKFGITEERANELDAKFGEITKGWNFRATCAEALTITIFPEIFEKGNYSNAEKLYLLSLTQEHSGTKQNYTSTIADFTKLFRAMSSKDQEKYFPMILDLYAQTSTKVVLPETTTSQTTTDVKPSTTETTETTTSEVSQTPAQTTTQTTGTGSKTNNSVIEKYQELILKDVQDGNTNLYGGNIAKALDDNVLSINDKITLLEYYRKTVDSLGMADHTDYRERILAERLYDSLTSGNSTAKEVIESLKRLDTIVGDNFKDTQQHVILSTVDNADFAVALYAKAQQEGVLADALKVAPPTDSVQKQLSLGTETKAINALFEVLNDNVTSQTNSEAKNFGITDSRARELDTKFDSLIKSYESRSINAKKSLETIILPEIIDSGKYTDNEKMYLLQKAFTRNTYINSKKTSMQNFTDVFRDMSNKGQEKYFTEIMNVFANFKAK